VHLGGATSGTI
ncbi:hypothetical protein A2U01_0101220, partial [Trifolium medium]|nr:hypothetical protein [Trifolium medium]